MYMHFYIFFFYTTHKMYTLFELIRCVRQAVSEYLIKKFINRTLYMYEHLNENLNVFF